LLPRRIIEWNDRSIVGTDDQQRRNLYTFERLSRQIRATAAADDGMDTLGTSCRGLQGSRGAGAGAEQSNAEFPSFRLLPEPVDCASESVPKQPDIEPKLPGEPINLVLVAGEKVHQ
jgi:hypothetical protein